MRDKGAIGTTRPLPETPAKEPKRAKRKKHRRVAREAVLEPREPRMPEFEAEDQHLTAILMLGVRDDGKPIRIKPFKDIRPGLDLMNQHRRRDEYGGRNRLLQQLGWTSYREYLDSPLWEKIRSRVLARGSCVLCGRPPSQVHHLRYTKDALRGRDDSQLVAICRGCHFTIEFRQRDREKLSPRQVRAKLNGLITKRRKATA